MIKHEALDVHSGWTLNADSALLYHRPCLRANPGADHLAPIPLDATMNRQKEISIKVYHD
jgi:hypothetical protein